MLKAYISFDHLFNIFSIDTSLKLATLWFDELIIQISGEDIITSALEKLAEREKWKNGTLSELKKFHIPVTKYLPKYQFLQKNPWDSNYKPLVEMAEIVLSEEVRKKDCGISNTGLRHEIAMVGAGLIDAVELWMLLNSNSLCTFLPSNNEQKVLKQLFYSANEPTALDSFSEILSSQIPDLSNYSWDEIVELRNHPFFGSFRDKVILLHKQINDENKNTITEIVNELANKDMKEMINFFRPSVKKSIIKGIASNILLPIPMNPFSVLFSLKDIKRDIDFSKKYGWLYFFLDLSKE